MKNWLNKKNILTLLLLAGIVLAIIQISRSAPPNPGHEWLDIGDSPSDALTASRGGTGQISLTADNVVLGNTTGAVSFMAPGSAGNVLTASSSAWASHQLNGLVLLNPSTSETNSSENASSVTETTLKNWVLNVATSAYRYFILESEVVANHNQNANMNIRYNWNFYEGSNRKKSTDWRLFSIRYTNLNQGLRYVATIKTIVPSTSTPAAANFKINGQMSSSSAASTMMVHSFRVYGVK
jgi:hypothetical protein